MTGISETGYYYKNKMTKVGILEHVENITVTLKYRDNHVFTVHMTTQPNKPFINAKNEFSNTSCTLSLISLCNPTVLALSQLVFPPLFTPCLHKTPTFIFLKQI